MEGKGRRNGIIAVASVVLSFLFALGASAVGTVTVKVDPAAQGVMAGEPFSVNVCVEDVTNMDGDQTTLNFDPGAMQATGIVEGDFLLTGGTTLGFPIINNTGGTAVFAYVLSDGTPVTGSGVLATINFDTNASAEGIFDLRLTDVILSNGNGNEITIDAIINGTVTILTSHAQFDTRLPENPYPSISGIHNGTIKPNKTIVVSNLYTYPCSGTGGHTEYVRIWGTGIDVNATWDGYVGDWHNITFNESFELQPGMEYNYTIITGSYPQIHHTYNLEAANGMGTITCYNFIDANGGIYHDRIPAIKLWS